MSSWLHGGLIAKAFRSALLYKLQWICSNIEIVNPGGYCRVMMSSSIEKGGALSPLEILADHWLPQSD